jgi:tetratricopeptide (TPR) repeat protein
MRWFVAVAVLACATPAAAQVSSKKRTDATAAYQDGQRRYLDEDYAGAAAQFEVAYNLDPDPAYEFNIAQAHRLAGNCDKALVWYRKFLVDAPNAPNVETVKKYIADEEAKCAKPAVPTVTAPPPPQPEQPAPVPPSHLRRNLGFAALGVGGVGVITGIVFTARVFDLADQREHLCDGCTEFPKARERELDRAGHFAEKMQWVGYGVGAAALGAGLYLLLAKPEKQESSIAVAWTHDGGFVSVLGRY